MSEKPKLSAKLGTAIKKAIRQLDESGSSTFLDIKKGLLSIYKTNGEMPDSPTIKQHLENAVNKGDLLKLNDGKYKLKETARRRRSRSRNRSKSTGRRRRSRSRKRSRGSRSGSRRRRRSSSGKGRKRSSSGRRRRRSGSRKRKTPKRTKADADEV